MTLQPLLCLCAARCQAHKVSPTVFNNSRAPLKRRQMVQWWWSHNCYCEPAERKKENLTSTCKLLEVVLPGGGHKVCPLTGCPSLRLHWQVQHTDTFIRWMSFVKHTSFSALSCSLLTFNFSIPSPCYKSTARWVLVRKRVTISNMNHEKISKQKPVFWGGQACDNTSI